MKGISPPPKQKFPSLAVVDQRCWNGPDWGRRWPQCFSLCWTRQIFVNYAQTGKTFQDWAHFKNKQTETKQKNNQEIHTAEKWIAVCKHPQSCPLLMKSFMAAHMKRRCTEKEQTAAATAQDTGRCVAKFGLLECIWFQQPAGRAQAGAQGLGHESPCGEGAAAAQCQ